MIRGTLGLVVLAGIVTPFGGSAHRLAEKGNRHYESEEYEAALGAYTEAQLHAAEAPELFYDIGNVLYRQGDFAGAAEAYERALASAPRELLPRVAFNLGNARYRQEEYADAAREYRRALEADPTDADAKRNLELALRALEGQPPSRQSGDGGDDSEEQDPQESERNGSSGDSGDEEQPQNEDRQQQEHEHEQEQEQQEQPDASSDGEQDSPEQRQEREEGDREDARDSGPSDAADSESAAPRDGGPEPQGMTPEEAARLLDTLEQQERENLRQQALRRARSRKLGTEKDW